MKKILVETEFARHSLKLSPLLLYSQIRWPPATDSSPASACRLPLLHSSSVSLSPQVQKFKCSFSLLKPKGRPPSRQPAPVETLPAACLFPLSRLSVSSLQPCTIYIMSFLMIYRRVGLKDLVLNVTIYPGASDASDGLSMIFRRWATKKSAGSTKNGRDSNPNLLGVKKFGGEKVIPGNIIVRQRGLGFNPGDYVGMGKDHTLYALKEGHVRFERHNLSGRKWVHVDPTDDHILHPVYTDAEAESP